ncbi:unnamed protein product [Rotaria sp. Silwood1]|nr:unnamed protein product [Rotaria sp. Silwood1]
MANIKTCLLLLFFVSLAASLDKTFEQHVAELRHFLESRDGNLEDFNRERRRHEDEIHRNKDAMDLDLRSFLKLMEDEVDDDKHKEVLGSRESSNSQQNDGDFVITLQNRAAMDTRLRILYTDAACQPYIVESKILWTHQTTSVTIPSNAQNMKVIVQKDMIGRYWRDAHTVSMSGKRLCLRIVGVTLYSKIHPCE